MYRDFSIKLLESLPMNNEVFLALLKCQNLFAGDLEEEVRAKTTRRQKAAYFLENAIFRPLNIDDFKPLCKLLTAMADEKHLSDSPLKQLATEIEQKLNKETSLITMKGTAKGNLLVRSHKYIYIATCMKELACY